MSKLQSIMTKYSVFVLQAISLVSIAIKFYRHLHICFFLQTFLFVALNKVSTSQYFTWYLYLLPAFIDDLNASKYCICCIGSAYLFGQALWLYNAYRLEFLMDNSFVAIWLSSLVYFGVTLQIIGMIVRNYRAALCTNKKDD
ncbi:hypothetical protein ACOME3_005670 [Neoechinorhynchus agilis]